ncbi:AGE family epimerase/isomerase [Micromonospora sp. RHAY321]|uniref:AGE family epimerase/isomerase n=1 Tax=Micromonospora sp. RHAY321 TaxID=2944807 RepID=UPI0027E334C1|nr:AGE family epimerase/isomerase [Micromonospora sp. RHAY321]
MTDVPRSDAAPTPAPAGSPELPDLDEFLADQTRTLLDTARRAVRPEGGFWWLTDDLTPDRSEPLHTWITCRMTHVAALAHRNGDPDAAALVDHGIAALSTLLRDERYGGWFGAVDQQGVPTNERKAGYDHAFVLLAASGAARAGRPGADQLLADVLAVVRDRFWDADAGAVRESWNRDWSVTEDYRGANSSMHMVEAFLAAAAATGDASWTDRALRIGAHLVDGEGARHDWRLPEHFTADWSPLPDYNRDRPADPFRPYGSTIGHWLEWARLLLELEAVLPQPPRWLLTDARALFAAAVRRGWAVDGADGFVYTIDWDDRPVVRARMHWVVAEAIGAAVTLHRRTGDAVYADWYRVFWGYARRYLVDDSGWRHELDPQNVPAGTVWHGRPDVYHAYQAVLLSRSASALGGPGPLAAGTVPA